MIHLILEAACLIHGLISMALSGRLEPSAGDPGCFYQSQVVVLVRRFGFQVEPKPY